MQRLLAVVAIGLVAAQGPDAAGAPAAAPGSPGSMPKPEASPKPAPEPRQPDDPVADLERKLEKAAKDVLSPAQASYRKAVGCMDKTLDSAEDLGKAVRKGQERAQARLRGAAKAVDEVVEAKREKLNKEFDDLAELAMRKAEEASKKNAKNASADLSEAQEALHRLQNVNNDLDEVADEQVEKLHEAAREETRKAQLQVRETQYKADELVHQMVHTEARIGDLAERAASHTAVKESAMEHAAEKRADGVEKRAKQAAKDASQAANAFLDSLQEQAYRLESDLAKAVRQDERMRHRNVTAVEAAVHTADARVGAMQSAAVPPFSATAAMFFLLAGACATLAGVAAAQRGLRVTPATGGLSEGLLVQ